MIKTIPMLKQFDLFYTPVVSKKIYYADLNIHQKINHKANQCGLHTDLLSFYNYFKRPLIQPIADRLTNNYLWHHKVNAGSENRINTYRKSLKQQQDLFK